MSQKNRKRLIWLFLIASIACTAVQAQPTEFTYQGRLLSADVPASGNHDFEFLLWDAAAGGSQLGPTLTLTDITVNNGVFSVRLDFGNVFPGADRFLEIKVRRSGDTVFTQLSPRQAITSAPYAVKSINADNSAAADRAANALLLGGIAPNQFVLTTDARLSDARPPLPNSPDYIQNTTSEQIGANFNIGGSGTIRGTLSARELDFQSRVSFNGVRVLWGAPSVDILLLGFNSTTSAIIHNATALGPRAFVESSNSMVLGSVAGKNGATSDTRIGIGTTTPNAKLTVKGAGSFFATSAARFELFNTTANLGYSQFTTDDGQWRLTTNDGLPKMVLTSSGNFGIGTSLPNAKLEVRDGEMASTGASGGRFSANNPNNQNARVLLDWYNDGTNDFPRIRYGGSGAGASNGFLIQGPGDNTKLTILNNGNVGIGTLQPAAKLEVNGTIKINSLGSSGGSQLCRNSSNLISLCSQSSIRFKQNVKSFTAGLDLLRRLRPVTFNWKIDDAPDFGLVAEEVAAVEPLLATRSENGEIEGVRYDRLGVVLVNAVREQQALIAAQQKQIDEQREMIRRQQVELDALKKLVCAQNAAAEACRPEK